MSRPRQFSEKDGYIYFIRTGSFMKIGFSQSYSGLRRLHKIQSVSPYIVEPVLTLPGTMGDEKDFHHRFRLLRHRGEWFRLEEALSAFIFEHTGRLILTFLPKK
jgi:hypothetical protein